MCGNNGCRVCTNLVASTEVAVVDNELQITIPSMTINNNEKVCLLIAQAIPAGADMLPVVLLNGTGGTVIQMINRCGDSVRADQIKSRKIYNVRIMTEPALAVVRSINLCCTAFVWPQITLTPAPVPSEASAVKSK